MPKIADLTENERVGLQSTMDYHYRALRDHLQLLADDPQTKGIAAYLEAVWEDIVAVFEPEAKPAQRKRGEHRATQSPHDEVRKEGQGTKGDARIQGGHASQRESDRPHREEPTPGHRDHVK